MSQILNPRQVPEIMRLRQKLAQQAADLEQLNAICATLVAEKHQGRAFVSIPGIVERQGWVIACKPQPSLGTVALTACDAQGKPRLNEDLLQAQQSVLCEVCKKPAGFASKDEKGNVIMPRCAEHLPPEAKIAAKEPIMVADVEVETKCGECHRKVGHNLDCSKRKDVWEASVSVREN